MLVGMGVRVVSQSMTLVLLLVAGRFLTADLFGVFVLSSIVMNFAIIQLYTGVYHYVLKEPDFEEGKRTAFSLQLLIAFLYAGAIGGAAYLVWITGSGELLAQLIAATALVPIIMIVSSWQEAVLLRNGHVKVYYGALFLSEVGGFCLALGMLFAGFGVWALVANRYFSAIAVAILLTFRAGPCHGLASGARMPCPFSSIAPASMATPPCPSSPPTVPRSFWAPSCRHGRWASTAWARERRRPPMTYSPRHSAS